MLQGHHKKGVIKMLYKYSILCTRYTPHAMRCKAAVMAQAGRATAATRAAALLVKLGVIQW